jgi:hypothetical protein
VARKLVSLPTGSTRAVTLRLNGKGKVLLKRFGRLPVTMTVKQGNTTAAKRKLRIKPKKRKKKHHAAELVPF